MVIELAASIVCNGVRFLPIENSMSSIILGFFKPIQRAGREFDE